MANSVEEWLELAELHRKVATQCLRDDTMLAATWSNAGFALECTIKAAIMRKERFNEWPSISSRKDLYSHRLEDLAKILGMTVEPTNPIAPSWSVACQWRRGDMYKPRTTRVIALSLFNAVFKDDVGVAPWIRQNFL